MLAATPVSHALIERRERQDDGKVDMNGKIGALKKFKIRRHPTSPGDLLQILVTMPQPFKLLVTQKALREQGCQVLIPRHE
jgi:hypothetical protein